MTTPAAVLPVLDVGTTITDDDERFPTAVVDATDVPAVSDLARVHAADGIGDIHTHAERIDVDDVSILLLGVALTSPVTAAFSLAFDRLAHRAFLEDVADAGRLVIATTDPGDAATDGPLWLAIDLDPDALRPVLADG